MGSYNGWVDRLVRIDSHRAIVHSYGLGSRNPQSNGAGLRDVWNTNFYKRPALQRESPGSIRCVAISTRRRYHKSLLSHQRNFRTPSSQSDGFMLVVRRLRARLITAIQKGIKLQRFTGNPFGRSLANIRYAAGHVARNPQWLETVCRPLRTTGPTLRAQRANWISPVMGRQILNLPSPSAAAPNTCPF